MTAPVPAIAMRPLGGSPGTPVLRRRVPGPLRVAPAFCRFAALLATLALAAAPRAHHAAPRGTDAAVEALGEEFLAREIARDPAWATRLGVHDEDDRLEPVTQATLAADLAWHREFERRLLGVDRAGLSFERRLDYDLLLARTRARQLDLEVVRPFERNASAYLPLVAGSVQSLLQRDFAPLCERVRAATARLRHVPEVLRAAKINLREPPRAYTETAIAQFAGALRFYRETVPALVADCRDARLAADLAEADSGAVRAAEDFLAYLREDLLPRSTGGFALGEETFRRKLLAEAMVATAPDSLLERGRREIAATHAAMESLAHRIRPGARARAVLDSLGRDHPPADSLVPFTVAQLGRVRAFLRQRDLLTLPQHEDLRVRETPLYARGLSFASMDSPGVWEKKATEAFYNVTPPDPAWDEARQREHLSFFNRYALAVISIHEALPGHYYQLLALRRAPSRLRQALTSAATTEGWAHYCEQMMIEQGFGGGDPRFRLAQLALAQQRLCRLVAAISLHTRGMTYDEAVQLFEREGYLSRVNAEREARRGMADPGYLSYTLGKWQILALREEVRAAQGGRFALKGFHDAFLRQGGAPVPLVRDGILHRPGRTRAQG